MAEGHMATNENRLLSTLPAEDYRRIAPKLERVSLALLSQVWHIE
jgi:hypothetical protein